MAEDVLDEVVEEAEIPEVSLIEKPGTVVDPEPTNPEGEVIVYEEDGSWHKKVKE